MFTLMIDGIPIQDLSLDQIGATIQQICDELERRKGHSDVVSMLTNEARILRSRFVGNPHEVD